MGSPCASAGGRGRRLLVHSLAQVDAVLERDLERAEHLAPALAVAVAGLERAFVEAPAFLGDLDERAAIVERLEADRHGGLVAGVFHLAALEDRKSTRLNSSH